MSLLALRWAMPIKVGSPGTKAVLVALAHHAKDSGECFPSQKLLAEETELTVRTIRTALQRLEEMGLLTRKRHTRPDGTRGTDRCMLAVGSAPTNAGDKGKPFPLAHDEEGQGEAIAGSPAELGETGAGLGETISDQGEIISPLTSFEPPQNLQQEPSPGESAKGASVPVVEPVVIHLDPRQRLIEDIVGTLMRVAGQDEPTARRTLEGWLRLAGGDLVHVGAVVAESALLAPRELVFTVEERLRKRRVRAHSPPRESTNGRIALAEERHHRHRRALP